MQKREFTDLDDLRLVYRGNKILGDLFSKSVHSIRQLTLNESSAKGFYRFLQYDKNITRIGYHPVLEVTTHLIDSIVIGVHANG